MPSCAAALKRSRARCTISFFDLGFVPVLLIGLLAASPVRSGQIGPESVDALPAADVVILGEIHDNPQHHRTQARAVAALRPSALVFEMLTLEQAAKVTPELRADPSGLPTALDWGASGWPDFAMYHPIFTAAPGAAIYGGALPRAVVRRAMAEDLPVVFGADAARYGLDLPLPPGVQTAREADLQSSHCDALPPEMLPGMLAAQRLRDAALARAIVQAVTETGGPVAVITGTGHARKDEGIPAALALGAPQLSVLSVGQLEADPGPDAPFDLWIVTDPVPRDDPCAGFAPQSG